MFTIFRRQDKPYEGQALRLYRSAMDRARDPVFFMPGRDGFGVADSMDGRFEVLALHVILLIGRLNRERESTAALSQAIFDVMFTDMDESLRAVGIGDMGIPRRMKFLMRGFNGRAHAYIDALEQAGTDALRAALLKNVYAGEAAQSAGADAGRLDRLEQYVLAVADHLAAHNASAHLLAGHVEWGVFPAAYGAEREEKPKTARRKGGSK